MQFDRPQTQRLPKEGIPQDSFLTDTCISSGLRDKSQQWDSVDEVKKPTPSKWSKTNGRWGPAKISSELKKAIENGAAKPVVSKSPVVNKSNEVTRYETKAEKQVVTQETKPSCPGPSRKAWEFGKRKTFLRPAATAKNNAAATQIQRIARGGWQRLKYRMAILQHKLDTKDERTATALDHVQQRLQRRNEKYLKKMKAKAAAENDQATLSSVAAMESQRVIAYLRKENKQIRQQNDKLHENICKLKAENARSEAASKRMTDCFSELQDHAKHLKETNEKLQIVVREYEHSINLLTEAVEIRQSFCLAEHTVRVNYVKCVGKVVEMMEERCKDDDLIEEVVCHCLKVGSDSEDDGSMASAESTV